MGNHTEIELETETHLISARFERVVRNLEYKVILASYIVDKIIPMDMETGATTEEVSKGEAALVFDDVKEEMIELGCDDLGMEVEHFIEENVK